MLSLAIMLHRERRAGAERTPWGVVTNKYMALERMSNR